MISCVDRDFLLIPPDEVGVGGSFEIRLQARGAQAAEFAIAELPQWTIVSCRMEPRGNFDFCSIRAAAPEVPGDYTLTATVVCGNERLTLSKKLRAVRRIGVMLSGGFLMFGPPNDRKPCRTFREGVKSLTDQAWGEQVDSWNEIGMKILVVTATYQPLTLKEGPLCAHYPSKYLPKTPDLVAEDPLEAVLAAADRNGQHVFIGFGHFKESGSLGDIARELFERYSAHPSFYGWYGSSEFSTALGSYDSVGKYWSTIKAVRDEFSPVMPLMISPYLEAGVDFNTPPEVDLRVRLSREFTSHRGIHPAFARFLAEHPARPEILMPQDGVGGLRHFCTVATSHRIFAAARDAAEKAGVHLWANCESFDLCEPEIPDLVPRFLNGGFDGEAGLVQQMEAVAPYVDKILTFSLPGFFAKPGLLPEIGGAPAAKQFEKYAAYRKHPRPLYRNLAKGRHYALTPEPSSLYPDDQRSKATDGLATGGDAFALDDARLIGYSRDCFDEKEPCRVLWEMKLDRMEQIDAIRCAGAARRNACEAEKVEFFVSPGNGVWHKIGETEKYRHGYAELFVPEPVAADAVRVVFTQKFTGDPWKTWYGAWLLIDEIEVLQKISE